MAAEVIDMAKKSASTIDDNLESFVDEDGRVHLVFDPEASGGDTPRGHTKVVSTQWVKIPGTKHELTTRIIIIRKKAKES